MKNLRAWKLNYDEKHYEKSKMNLEIIKKSKMSLEIMKNLRRAMSLQWKIYDELGNHEKSSLEIL